MKLKVCLVIILIMSLLNCYCLGSELEEGNISNVFIETDLRQTLRDLSVQANIQIIPDSIVQGLVSVEFNEVPLKKCLEMLLFPLGFTFKKMKGYYIVASTDPRSSSFNLISRTEKVKLRYIKAIDAVYNLPNFLKVYIKINKDRNILTITAPDEIIARVKEDILVLDKQPKQVLIEVVVTELSSEHLKKIGIEWAEELAPTISGEYLLYDKISTYELRGGLAKQALLTIGALAQDGKVNIRAKPKILTADTEQAVINIGTEKYVSLDTETGSRIYTRLQSVSAGIKVTIMPYIGEENDITLNIDIEVSDVLPGTFGDVKLSVNRRSAKTTVHLKNDQTIGIGGLLQESKEVRESKFPLLWRIPFLGKVLFSSKKDISAKSELIIFITPKIVNSDSLAIKLR